jgi:hypothetical protein
MKDIFIEVIDILLFIQSKGSEELKDDAFIFIEFIKEFYMKYPLRSNDDSVLCSDFEENDFYSLADDTMINYTQSLSSGTH